MNNKNNKGHQSLRKGRISLPNQIYHITTTTHQRTPIFEDFLLARSACRCFEQLDCLGDARLLAWVLMPDHAHWLIVLGSQVNLNTVVGRLKATSARAVNKQRGSLDRVWAKSFHDHALRKEEDVISVARYIIANPLRAGLVKQVGDYPFWNCVWL